MKIFIFCLALICASQVNGQVSVANYANFDSSIYPLSMTVNFVIMEDNVYQGFGDGTVVVYYCDNYEGCTTRGVASNPTGYVSGGPFDGLPLWNFDMYGNSASSGQMYGVAWFSASEPTVRKSFPFSAKYFQPGQTSSVQKFARESVRSYTTFSPFSWDHSTQGPTQPGTTTHYSWTTAASDTTLGPYTTAGPSCSSTDCGVFHRRGVCNSDSGTCDCNYPWSGEDCGTKSGGC